MSRWHRRYSRLELQLKKLHLWLLHRPLSPQPVAMQLVRAALSRLALQVCPHHSLLPNAACSVNIGGSRPVRLGLLMYPVIYVAFSWAVVAVALLPFSGIAQILPGNCASDGPDTWSDVHSGPVTRRRRRLNSGEDAPVVDAAVPDSAPAAGPSSEAGPPSTGGASGSREKAATTDAVPQPQKLEALDTAIISPKPPRPSVASLRSLPASPVVVFTQSLAYKIPSRSSAPQSKASQQVSMYDVSASQKVRRTLVLLCQLSPQLIEPVFDAVVKVFQGVRGGLQSAVDLKQTGGASTSADAEAASAELSASSITQIGSSARVLLEIVATLRTLLTVLQSYSHFAGLVRGAIEAAQGAQVAEGGTVLPAERARVLAEMQIGEVEALEERKVSHTAFSEDVAAGHVARVHAEAHCQLLSHLKQLSESAKADAAAAEADKAEKPAGTVFRAGTPCS